nr:MAG TPA: hypothetical protein [Caudoviricetes sp.]
MKKARRGYQQHYSTFTLVRNRYIVFCAVILIAIALRQIIRTTHDCF